AAVEKKTAERAAVIEAKRAAKEAKAAERAARLAEAEAAATAAADEAALAEAEAGDGRGWRPMQPTEYDVPDQYSGRDDSSGGGSRWAIIGVAVAATLVLGVVVARIVMPSGDDTSGIVESRSTEPTTAVTTDPTDTSVPATTEAPPTTEAPSTTEAVDPAVAAAERLASLVEQDSSDAADLAGGWVLELAVGYEGYTNDAGDPFGPVELMAAYDEFVDNGTPVLVVAADDWSWRNSTVEGAYYIISAESWVYPRDADAWAVDQGIESYDYNVIEG
ncbi:MAG: hypothetical protein ACO3C1_12085, partial [Ilumatobacteraceae bacterium]